MASRTPTVRYGTNDTALNGHVNAELCEWTGLLNGDDGVPLEGADWADRTIQFDGTFGAGGSISLLGSNDGTNYFALTDPQGNAITKTAAGLEVIEEGPRYIKPSVTAGDGTTSLNARIWGRRNR